MSQMIDAAIIGGGITGLSAAWYLQNTRPDARYTLLESSHHWGGKVITEYLEGGFIIDGGPESFVTRKPEVWDLAHELGIGDRLMVPGSETRGMHILHDGSPYPVPLSPVAFVTSDLLTLRGKLRLLREPFAPARTDDGDESLADFTRRRLGDEALRRMIGPILGGIYNTDPETQSILYSSPIMREMEKEHGSLVKAMLNRKKRDRPTFITFARGAGELVSALVERLHGDLRLNAAVRRITPSADGFMVELATGETLQAASVILATPANTAAALLHEGAPEAAQILGAIRHASIGTLSLAYRRADLPAGLKQQGLMIPRREGRPIDAVTWTSAKIATRAPDDYALVRVFFGGAQPHVVEYTDEMLLAAVRAELEALYGIRAEPVMFTAYRWPQSYPQADVGHLDRVAQAEALLPAGIYLAGSAYRGLAVPDCIRQGKDAAALVAQQLANVPVLN